MDAREREKLLAIANNMDLMIKEFRKTLRANETPLRLTSDILDLSESSHRLLADLEKEIECSKI